MTASAEVVLDNPKPWGATCGLEGSTYSMDGSWAGAGTYLITEDVNMYDASANDYVMLKYTGNTGKFAFKVIYNKFVKEETWGKVYADDNVVVSSKEGVAYIKLNKTDKADGGKTYAEEVREIQLQDQGAAVSFTVEKLAFITAEEYEALKAGGEDPEPAGEQLDIEKSSFWGNGTREGNVVTFTKEWDGLAWWIGSKKGVTKIVVEFEEATEIKTQLLVQFNDVEDASKQAEAGSTTLEMDLTEGDIKQLAVQNEKPGVIKVKSVTLYSGTDSIDAIASESSAAAAIDLFGNAGATKGFMVKGGKKVYVK